MKDIILLKKKRKININKKLDKRARKKNTLLVIEST